MFLLSTLVRMSSRLRRFFGGGLPLRLASSKRARLDGPMLLESRDAAGDLLGLLSNGFSFFFPTNIAPYFACQAAPASTGMEASYEISLGTAVAPPPLVDS